MRRHGLGRRSNFRRGSAVRKDKDKVFGEKEKVFGKQEKVFGEQEKVFGEQEKVFGECPQGVRRVPRMSSQSRQRLKGFWRSREGSISATSTGQSGVRCLRGSEQRSRGLQRPIHISDFTTKGPASHPRNSSSTVMAA